MWFRGEFADKLDQWADDPNFRTAVRLTPLQQRDATGEECVLRFFAFLERYKKFDHNVAEFLNHYMESAAKNFDYSWGTKIFSRTFSEIAKVFPNGIRRPDRKSSTPLNLFEGIAVGAALALQSKAKLKVVGLDAWMASQELRGFYYGGN